MVKLWNPETSKKQSLMRPIPSVPDVPQPLVVSSPKSSSTRRKSLGILHIVDRHDLLKLYGLVVKYYENHPVTGAGLVLWGDLQVLFDSQEGEKMGILSSLSELMERIVKAHLEIAKMLWAMT
ncbi:hypothetical protein Tco_0156000 [Tanacetum coccineum]